MSSKKKNFKELEEESKNSLNLTDIIGLCLSNWYWFLICLCLTCAGAAVYLRMTPPVYTRTTSLVIKEDASSQAVNDIFTKVRGNTLRQSNASLKNEIIAFQKPALMKKVVERLGLDYKYEIRGRLRTTALYGSSLPIKVAAEGVGSNTNVEFTITINDADHATLKFTDKNGKTTKLQAQFGKKFKSPLGRTVISKTQSFYTSDDPITIVHTGFDSAAGDILSRLNIRNEDEESTVINISLSDENIERADDVLNTLIAIYNENWVKNRNMVIEATNKFILERLETIENELSGVENEMTNYKVAHHTIDFENEGAQYQARSMEYDNQNLEISKELSLVMYFRGVVQKATNPTVTLPLPAGVHNSALAEQVGQYNALVLNRSNLISSSTEENPLVGDVDKQMAVLHNGILTTIENHISTLNSQMGILNMSSSRNNAEIDATPHKQKIYVDIERRRKIKEQLYTFLLQTREQNQLNQAFAAYNTRVLQPSTGSNFQSYPDVKRIWMIAVGLGLLIPFLCLVLREWSNSKVRGRRDIDKLTIPFVGELPQLEFDDQEKISKFKQFVQGLFKSKKKKHHRHGRSSEKKNEKYVGRVVVEHGNRNVINEAFRVLRTNLEFMLGNNPEMKVVMTTSANPHSGKTFVTYNLAKCMSLKGKKVCMIDLDLRRRSLSHYVGKPDKGVSDYINGAVDNWRDLLVNPEGNENLFILPVGTLPPNPAEIISYDRFGELIAEIRKEYDYVFFDCPPVEIVADTSILSKYADVTLFVIRVGIMEIEFLPIIEGYYRENKFNNMGIILVGTLTANSRYGYRRYGYRYGYGYGYGYGGYGYGSGYDEGYSKEK